MARIASRYTIGAPPTPPDSWHGTLADFFATYVVPWWPPPGSVAAWTEAAIVGHERPDSLLFVRGGADKGWLHSESGRRVVITDNAPGIWILLRARDGSVAPLRWPELIEQGQLPVLKMRASGRPDRPWTHATTPLSQQDASVIWSRGLKHCHIFELHGRAGHNLTQRSLRNLALMNYFVFPNGLKHFRTERDGWSEVNNTIDLGESRTVCDYAFREVMLYVSSVAPDLAERFLLAAGALMPSKPVGDLRIKIERRRDSSGAITLGTYRETQSSPTASHPPRGRAETNTRLWTLRRDNRAHCHGVVDLSESPLCLDLSWCPDSQSGPTHVGTFRLDLHTLLAGGYIRNDPAGSAGTRLRLRVVMTDDGRFYIQNGCNGPRWLLV